MGPRAKRVKSSQAIPSNQSMQMKFRDQGVRTLVTRSVAISGNVERLEDRQASPDEVAESQGSPPEDEWSIRLTPITGSPIGGNLTEECKTLLKRTADEEYGSVRMARPNMTGDEPQTFMSASSMPIKPTSDQYVQPAKATSEQFFQ
ncbi:hypothetical protein CTI12_AA010030 [Artemisia annua]|uniref:Uncharacterized protein n=1 Tax=Artemisia annua TaxID=35608 RepID=A0A2U1QMS6_ARTAN|nr:hypothetical protein CTI12_AA010030 [Artemisia annua]